MSNRVNAQFPIFNDLEGLALESGSIYVGEYSKNAETNAISTYWDEDLTIAAAQPLSTLGGYIVRNGTPANVYVHSTTYSMTVKNKKGEIVYSELIVHLLEADEYGDDEFRIFDSDDTTKKIAFDASGISSETTRTIAMANTNIDLADIVKKVSLTGNETIAGIKSFSSFPITPSSAPITDYQTVNKKYVDDKILYKSVAIICDQKAYNVNGGTFTQAAWRTRDLNTEISDADGIVSITANQFSLATGTYTIEWSAPAGWGEHNSSRLYNSTDAAIEQYGSSEVNLVNNITVRSTGSATVTIAASKSFEIQHRIARTRETKGFGVAQTTDSTAVSIYTIVKILKHA